MSIRSDNLCPSQLYFTINSCITQRLREGKASPTWRCKTNETELLYFDENLDQSANNFDNNKFAF